MTTNHRIPFPSKTVPPEQLEPVSPAFVDVAVWRLVARFDPEPILVFGSVARSEARPDSDLDLPLVLGRCPDRIAAMAAMFEDLRDAPFAKDILVATPDGLQKDGGPPGLGAAGGPART